MDIITDSDRYWDKVFGTEGPRTVSEWDVEDYAEEEGVSLEEARAILTRQAEEA